MRTLPLVGTHWTCGYFKMQAFLTNTCHVHRARTRVLVDPHVIDLAGFAVDSDASHVCRQLEEVVYHDDLHKLAQQRWQTGHCISKSGVSSGRMVVRFHGSRVPRLAGVDIAATMRPAALTLMAAHRQAAKPAHLLTNGPDKDANLQSRSVCSILTCTACRKQ